MLSFVINWRGSLWLLSDDLKAHFSGFGPYLLAPARRLFLALGARTLGLRLTMLEHRLRPTNALTKEIRLRLPEILRRKESLLAPPTDNHGRHLRRSLILRSPCIEEGVITKGVLLIKFTETFRYFHYLVDVRSLLRYFHIVLEPSWSGYCLPEILFWAQYDQPIIVQASEARDRKFLETLGTCLVPASFGASDWVDHRVFRPLSLAKEFDVIYVANLSPIKRVHVFLRAVNALAKRRDSVRAALVLSSWGGNKSTFDQLLNLYDLGDRLTVFMNLSQQKLNETLNLSKVSVLLSTKEGSNKTLFESMFADVPVLLLRNNIGVNKSYINQHTGLLVSEKELPDAIECVASMSPPLSPRSWALRNIAPEITTRKLESLLETQISNKGARTSPLWIKVNSPEATYMDPTVSSRVPAIAELLECFSLRNSLPETRAAMDVRIRNLFRLA